MSGVSKEDVERLKNDLEAQKLRGDQSSLTKMGLSTDSEQAVKDEVNFNMHDERVRVAMAEETQKLNEREQVVTDLNYAQKPADKNEIAELCKSNHMQNIIATLANNGVTSDPSSNSNHALPNARTSSRGVER